MMQFSTRSRTVLWGGAERDVQVNSLTDWEREVRCARVFYRSLVAERRRQAIERFVRAARPATVELSRAMRELGRSAQRSFEQMAPAFHSLGEFVEEADREVRRAQGLSW